MVPFHFLIYSTLFLSTVMAVSSCSWIGMWVAFEINTLSFIPFINSNGAANYLLAQSLGSAIILSGPAFGNEIFVIVGAILKAGVAPVHAWFPQVMDCVSWLICLVLSTWQNIAPISVLLAVHESSMFSFFIVASALIGALGAVKQSRLRAVIAYSSITHMAWTLTGMLVGTSVALLYLAVYCLTSALLIQNLANTNNNTTVTNDLSLIWLLFSMGGVPPLIGLLPNMLVLISAPLVVAVPLIVSSVIILFVYTSLILASIGKSFFNGAGPSTFLILCAPCIFL